MTNLLPLEEKKKVVRIYRIRLVIVVLGLLSATFLFGLVFLLPSYFLVSLKEERLTEDLQTFSKGTFAETRKEVEASVRRTNAELLIFEKADKTLVSDAISTVSRKRSELLKFTGFFFQNVSGSGGSSVKLVVRGTAQTRNALTAFADALKKESLFSSVVLPVSDLAKNKDLSFSLELILNTTKQP